MIGTIVLVIITAYSKAGDLERLETERFGSRNKKWKKKTIIILIGKNSKTLTYIRMK